MTEIKDIVYFKNQVAKTVKETELVDRAFFNDWGSLEFYFKKTNQPQLIVKAFQEAAELLVSQYKTELSSKEAMIGELKEALETSLAAIHTLQQYHTKGMENYEYFRVSPQHELRMSKILAALNKLK